MARRAPSELDLRMEALEKARFNLIQALAAITPANNRWPLPDSNDLAAGLLWVAQAIVHMANADPQKVSLKKAEDVVRSVMTDNKEEVPVET